MRHSASLIVFAASLAFAVPALAQNADEEKISKACEIVYAQLCKGIAPGPEMVGKCNRMRPSVSDKVPTKCTTDFQNKVEGYEDFMRDGGGK